MEGIQALKLHKQDTHPLIWKISWRTLQLLIRRKAIHSIGKWSNNWNVSCCDAWNVYINKNQLRLSWLKNHAESIDQSLQIHHSLNSETDNIKIDITRNTNVKLPRYLKQARHKIRLWFPHKIPMIRASISLFVNYGSQHVKLDHFIIICQVTSWWTSDISLKKMQDYDRDTRHSSFHAQVSRCD